MINQINRTGYIKNLSSRPEPKIAVTITNCFQNFVADEIAFKLLSKQNVIVIHIQKTCFTKCIQD